MNRPLKPTGAFTQLAYRWRVIIAATLMSGILGLFGTATHSYAKSKPTHTYQFVAIQGLIEQEIALDIFQRISEQAQLNITVSPLPAKRAEHSVFNDIKDGEILRIFEYGKNNPKVIRVPTPYYKLRTAVFFNKNKPLQITQASELAQYRVGVVRGVKHTQVITRGLNNVIQSNTTEQLFSLLNSGRIDIALTSKIDGLMTLNQQNLHSISHQEQSLATLNLYIYVNHRYPQMVNQLEQAIVELTRNGQLQAHTQQSEQNILGIAQ